jgi:hypothetical protein
MSLYLPVSFDSVVKSILAKAFYLGEKLEKFCIFGNIVE